MTQIEKIEAIIIYFECKKIGNDVTDDLKDVFEMISTLRKTPDKYLAAYRAFLEWKIPLLQRTSIRDSGDKPDLPY